MRRTKTLRQRIERRIARKRGEDGFCLVSSGISVARIKSCARCVFSCVKNASCGSATGSMVVLSSTPLR